MGESEFRPAREGKVSRPEADQAPLDALDTERATVLSRVRDRASWISQDLYNHGKAKLFNILEAQFEGPKLEANKRLVEDVLSALSAHAQTYIVHAFGVPTEEA